MKKQLLEEITELKATVQFNVKLNLMLIKRLELVLKENERLKNDKLQRNTKEPNLRTI